MTSVFRPVEYPEEEEGVASCPTSPPFSVREMPNLSGWDENIR